MLGDRRREAVAGFAGARRGSWRCGGLWRGGSSGGGAGWRVGVTWRWRRKISTVEVRRCEALPGRSSWRAAGGRLPLRWGVRRCPPVVLASEWRAEGRVRSVTCSSSGGASGDGAVAWMSPGAGDDHCGVPGPCQVTGGCWPGLLVEVQVTLLADVRGVGGPWLCGFNGAAVAAV